MLIIIDIFMLCSKYIETDKFIEGYNPGNGIAHLLNNLRVKIPLHFNTNSSWPSQSWFKSSPILQLHGLVSVKFFNFAGSAFF